MPNLTLMYLHSSNGRYNPETGEFTVPVGGGGLYFFYTNLWSVNEENSVFQISVNGNHLCRAEASVDEILACGVTIQLIEGG